jgi:hypothetical protein
MLSMKKFAVSTEKSDEPSDRYMSVGFCEKYKDRFYFYFFFFQNFRRTLCSCNASPSSFLYILLYN